MRKTKVCSFSGLFLISWHFRQYRHSSATFDFNDNEVDQYFEDLYQKSAGEVRAEVLDEIFLNKQTLNLEFSKIICVYSFMLRTNLGFRARRCRGETRTCTHKSSVFGRRWSRVIFTWQTRFKSEEQFTEVRTYTIMPLPAKIINKLGFKQIIFLLLQVQVSHGHLDQ